jgi:hypothetical protein
MNTHAKLAAMLRTFVAVSLSLCAAGACHGGPIIPGDDESAFYQGVATGSVVNGPRGAGLFLLLANFFDKTDCGFSQAQSNYQRELTEYSVMQNAVAVGLLRLDIHLQLRGDVTRVDFGTSQPVIDIGTSVASPFVTPPSCNPPVAVGFKAEQQLAASTTPKR